MNPRRPFFIVALYNKHRIFWTTNTVRICTFRFQNSAPEGGRQTSLFMPGMIREYRSVR